MLTIMQKNLVLQALQDASQNEPDGDDRYAPIIAEVRQDIRRHETALQRARQRNDNKKSRRDQRGPII